MNSKQALSSICLIATLSRDSFDKRKSGKNTIIYYLISSPATTIIILVKFLSQFILQIFVEWR